MTRFERLPLARREGLLVERLSDEVLIYDLDRRKAHCLNQTAALIWDCCDGKTSVDKIAGILAAKLKAPVCEDLVSFGLSQLARNQLLDRLAPGPLTTVSLSRRNVIRRIGLIVSIPLVVSVLAPKASAVNSGCANRFCVTSGDCITGCPTCNPVTHTCF